MPRRSRTRICTCSLCRNHGQVIDDPACGSIAGKRIGYNEYLEHMRMEALRQGAPERLRPIQPVPGDRSSEASEGGREEDSFDDADDDDEEEIVPGDGVGEYALRREGIGGLADDSSDSDSSSSSTGSRESYLSELLAELMEKIEDFSDSFTSLTFQSPPDPSSDEELPPAIRIELTPNQGDLPLRSNRPENIALLNYQTYLLDTYHACEAVIVDDSIERLAITKGLILETVMDELMTLEKAKRRIWNEQRATQKRAREYAAAGVPVFNTAQMLSPPDITQYPLYLICEVLMAVLNIICNLSIHRINSFVLPMLKAILRARIPEVDVPRNFGDVADGFPDTIQAVISQLSLEPKTSTFVCCKECFSCYDPQDSPDTCTFKDASDSPLCGTPLFTERRRKGQTLREPVREIHFQDFEDWLARLLSRPGMEEILDRDVYQTGAGIGELFDIWDGEVLRNFQGPDGSNFFTCKGPGNLRLVFAICMDNFNPFFNKHGGKHYSAGVICLICLNLPPGMRHLIENIFIYCVVPGPREVELEKINHVQRRLIDTFLKFWQPGVYYSNTSRYPQGRLVNAAIVPLLGDFLAAKKLSGINRWCTQCTLPAISAKNLDISTWPTRMTSEEHRRLAEEWKALGVRERNKHFRNHCIRWSELLRLPYWKPVEYTLVEFSHNLLTNNAERHLRTLLGGVRPSSGR